MRHCNNRRRAGALTCVGKAPHMRPVSMILAPALGLALLAGCDRANTPAPAAGAMTAATAEAATAAAAPGAPAKTAWAAVENFDQGMVKAKAEGKSVPVDAWAPWCHTCLSLQNYVLNDPSLASLADRIVLVELDTDRPENAGFMEKYTVSVWLTFFVIDPQTTKAALDQGGKAAECLRVGPAHLGEVEGAAVPADYASILLSCTDDPAAGADAKAARAEAITRLRAFTDVPPADASADDRADALNILSHALADDGAAAGGKKAQEARLAVLEAAVARARNARVLRTTRAPGQRAGENGTPAASSRRDRPGARQGLRSAQVAVPETEGRYPGTHGRCRGAGARARRCTSSRRGRPSPTVWRCPRQSSAPRHASGPRAVFRRRSPCPQAP